MDIKTGGKVVWGIQRQYLLLVFLLRETKDEVKQPLRGDNKDRDRRRRFEEESTEMLRRI